MIIGGARSRGWFRSPTTKGNGSGTAMRSHGFGLRRSSRIEPSFPICVEPDTPAKGREIKIYRAAENERADDVATPSTPTSYPPTSTLILVRRRYQSNQRHFFHLSAILDRSRLPRSIVRHVCDAIIRIVSRADIIYFDNLKDFRLIKVFVYFDSLWNFPTNTIRKQLLNLIVYTHSACPLLIVSLIT